MWQPVSPVIRSLSFSGDQICRNKGDGVYVAKTGGLVQLNADPSRSTEIHDNTGYEMRNDDAFTFTTDLDGEGNVDARNVWWGTTDASAIGSEVFDFFDDSSKGIVFIDPIATTPGHSLLGDVTGDGHVNGLDVDPFIELLLSGLLDCAADMNQDGQVNGLDVDPFAAVILGTGTTLTPTPEPSTMVLAVMALLGAVGYVSRRMIS